MSVILFPARASFVEIDGGVCTESTDRGDVGRFLIFVDIVHPDGAHLCVWSGASYRDAVESARSIAAGAPCLRVVDRLVEAS